MITRDEAKRAGNLARHGLDFADVAHFDFDSVLLDIDGQDDDGEIREVAIGRCGTGLCSLVIVRCSDDDIPVISFRKATKQEMRRYAEA